jgi:hypothetical protein
MGDPLFAGQVSSLSPLQGPRHCDSQPPALHLTCPAISSTMRHVRGWLSLGLAATATFLLCLNALAQAREQAQVRGSRAVGVLLRGRHPFCTASIVNSPGGNLIITAAHCLARKLASTTMFAPDYYDDSAPLGEWQVTGQVFPPGWFPHRNINQDFAFLTVRGDVQARAGAESLGFSLPAPTSVRVEAYSLTGRLTICNRRPGVIAAAGQQQLSFACPGYANASSGGPFLTDISRQSGLGTIVGLIGGYQAGGSSPSMSYSSPFGMVLHKLYSSMTHVSEDTGGKGLAALPVILGGGPGPAWRLELPVPLGGGLARRGG